LLLGYYKHNDYCEIRLQKLGSIALGDVYNADDPIGRFVDMHMNDKFVDNFCKFRRKASFMFCKF